MSGPWEKYQTKTPAATGPWTKYAQPSATETQPTQPAPPTTPQPTVPTGTITQGQNDSWLDRARKTVANSAIGHALESGMPKVADALNLHPDETVNNPDYQAHKEQFISPEYLVPQTSHSTTANLTRGALRTVGSAANAPNIATTAAIAATGGVAAPIKYATQALKYGMAIPQISGLYQNTADAINKFRSGDSEGGQEALGGLGVNAALTLPAVADMAPRIGGKMQDTGVELINRTIGRLQADTKRGANPGEGYFQAGFGPSFSMRSIANKAAAAKEATGIAIGTAYDNATASGTTIPTEQVASVLRAPISKAKSIVQGPGGTGNIAPLRDYAASFRPAMAEASQKGGFTPRELFDIKKNVSDNTRWNDSTQFDVNRARQQTVGGLSGMLSDVVPETAPLNSQYQNLGVLAKRSNLRAQTGSMPLTSLMGKTALGVAGAATGAALHAGPMGALAAVPALALDSVPAKTTAASALYYGGKGLVKTGGGLSRLFSGLELSPTATPPPISGLLLGEGPIHLPESSLYEPTAVPAQSRVVRDSITGRMRKQFLTSGKP